MNFNERHLYAIFQTQTSLNGFLSDFYIDQLLASLHDDVCHFTQTLTQIGVSSVPIIWFDTHYGHQYDHAWTQSSLYRALPRPDQVYLPGLTKVVGLHKVNLTHWVYKTELQDFIAFAREPNNTRFITEAALAGGIKNHCDEILYVDEALAVGVRYWSSPSNTQGKNIMVTYRYDAASDLHPVIKEMDVDALLADSEIPSICHRVLTALGWDGSFQVHDSALSRIVSVPAVQLLNEQKV